MVQNIIYGYWVVASIIGVFLIVNIIKDFKEVGSSLGKDFGPKFFLIIPFAVIMAALWPLVIVWELISLIQKSSEDRVSNELPSHKLIKRWAKAVSKNLNVEGIGDTGEVGIESLRRELNSVINEELYEYSLDGFLKSVEVITEDLDFDSIYFRVKNDSDNYKEESDKYRHTRRFSSVGAPRDYWIVITTRRFKKSISRLDPKTRKRLTSAIHKISLKPKQLEGNTVKPLSHDLKDCWRYRLGDNRLIYRPDEKTKTIVLLIFANRSGIYS